jgi:hypothetical protein
MPNQFNLPIDEWIAQLRAEPASLGKAAAPLVRAAAERAADDIRNAYPVGPPRKQNNWTPGNLRAGVDVRTSKSDPAVSSGVLVSRAPHAHLYEDGTHVARAHPTFWPIAHAYQKALIGDVVDMLESREGYEVTGSG